MGAEVGEGVSQHFSASKLLNCICALCAGRDLVGARRFGPRPLDLDIIFYGNQDVQHEVLSVPHVRWADRGSCQLVVCGYRSV
jgi:7,8-dihydro-6-hydroxymethylpterin-pyrophosphokinase